MTDELKDITQTVLTQTELTRDVAAVRKRCLKLPMVAACETALTAFKGRPNGTGGYDVLITGKISIKSRVNLGVTLDAEGTGEIDPSGSKLDVKSVRILNDFQGVLGRILQMSGYVAGRSLGLRPRDSQVIRAALSS